MSLTFHRIARFDSAKIIVFVSLIAALSTATAEAGLLLGVDVTALEKVETLSDSSDENRFLSRCDEDDSWDSSDDATSVSGTHHAVCCSAMMLFNKEPTRVCLVAESFVEVRNNSPPSHVPIALFAVRFGHITWF